MEISTENAKITDSGYSNSCSNSQSQKSNDSSVLKNSNHSASCSYYSENPSNFRSSNEVLPQPLSKRKDKEHKKKSKTTMTVDADFEEEGRKSFAILKNPSKLGFETKTEEVADVAMMDIKDSRKHNNVLVSDLQAGLSPQTNSLDNSRCRANEEFLVIISMNDGLVLYTIPFLLKTQEFNSEDWIGKSFLDFVYHKDRETFVNWVNEGISLPQGQHCKGGNGSKVTLFCRLLKNDNAETNPVVEVTKLIRFAPFYLTLTVHDLRKYLGEELLETMFLVVTAQSIKSAYKEYNCF